MDRASDYGSEGCRFDSGRAHQRFERKTTDALICYQSFLKGRKIMLVNEWVETVRSNYLVNEMRIVITNNFSSQYSEQPVYFNRISKITLYIF